MTWAELWEIINNMSEEERSKTVLVYDADDDRGPFYPVDSCTEFDADEPGADFSCNIHSKRCWW